MRRLISWLLHRRRGVLPVPDAGPPRLRFVSIRDDGLGMRLNTLLDAMVLAALHDAEFGFLWDQAETHVLDLQTTSSVVQVFTPAFLARHLLTPGDWGPDAPGLPMPMQSAQAMDALMVRARVAGALTLDQPRDLADVLPHLVPRLDPGAYARAFDALEFTAPVRQAIAAALAVPLGAGAVAIHIRGGDILHGTHSFHGAYLHKAPSVPEIEAEAAALMAQGHQVWLIGQEPDVQRALATRRPGLRAFGVTDHRPVMDDVSAVLFDAVFMSRMTHILGGNSGVTLLSRRLGSVPFTDLARSAARVRLDALRADPMANPAYAGVTAASRAHVYLKPVIAADPADWTSIHLDLVRLALAHRPDNAFLQLILVCVLAQLGQTALAEAQARALLTHPPLPKGIGPDLGFAFLTEGAHYFPMHQTAALARLAPQHAPASAVFAALRAALDHPSSQAREAALQTLNAAEAALAPAGIDPVLRSWIVTCLDRAPDLTGA